MMGKLKWYLRSFLSWEAVDLWVTDLEALEVSREREGAAMPPDIHIRLLGEPDIDALMRFHDTHVTEYSRLFDAAEVRRRLALGHQCCLCLQGGEIVGFRWAGLREVRSPDLRCTFAIGKDWAVGYNTFIRKESRGHNLARHLMLFGCAKLQEAGVRRSVGYVSTRNRPMIRSCSKVGARPMGRIHYGYVLGRHFIIQAGGRESGFRIASVEDPWSRWKGLLQALRRLLGRA